MATKELNPVAAAAEEEKAKLKEEKKKFRLFYMRCAADADSLQPHTEMT